MHIDPLIEVFPATTPQARLEAFQVRLKGYRRYFNSLEECMDDLDYSPQTTLLLARHKFGGPLGTIRIVDRRRGSVELDKFLDLDDLLGGTARSCAEATRFSVPPGPHAKVVKLLLWKAFMRFCKSEGIGRMVVWAKAAASRDYRYLLFQSLGAHGNFQHPVLGSYEHETFITEMADVEERFKNAAHPLHDFMFVQQHTQIRL
jgi:hypothetical protein